jgi:hypothetical protein
MSTKRIKPGQVQLPIPTWAGALYLILCVFLIPWTVHLSSALPTRHLSQHWDVSWGGLDVGIIVALLFTAILAFKKSKWVTIPATAVGTLLLFDAWFDIMSSRPGAELNEAILMAAFFEIPIALMSYALAFHVLDKNLS